MNAKALLSKYIRNSERVFGEIRQLEGPKVPNRDRIAEVVEYAKRYLSDAKYYGEKQQYETGLVSVAYCEGMLDALRLLGLVTFTWPETKSKT
jgi:FAD synthetase